MRRLIWSCAALMVAAAAWFYLAATYVCNYPDSYFARCAAVVYDLGTDYNPMYRLSRGIVRRVRSGMDSVMEKQGYVRVPVVRQKPACEPCAPALETIAAGDGFKLIQVQPTVIAEDIQKMDSGDAYRPAGTVVQEDAYYPGASEESTSGVTTISVPPSAPQDDNNDGAPKTMPPVEDSKTDEEAPSTMPYEDDSDEDGAAVLEFWKGFFKEKTEPKAAAEESETPDSNEYQMPASHYSSHPSCSDSRTVTCPYTGKTYPIDPKDDEPAPTTSMPKKKKKKKKDDVGNPGGKVSKIIEQEKGTEETPVHPEVDTTEYRPSDAKKGEFDPMPEE